MALLAPALALADPGSYPILSSHGWWVWAGLTALIVAIETPILVALTGWAWKPALLGVILANVVSTFAGVFHRPGLLPDLPVLLVLAVGVELVVLLQVAVPGRRTVTPLRPARLLPAVVLMNLATVWVSPALEPWPTRPEKGRQRVCAFQLHNIAAATKAYASDHADRLPPVTTPVGLRDCVSSYLPRFYADASAMMGSAYVPELAFHCPATDSRWALSLPETTLINYELGLPLARSVDDESAAARFLLADDRPRHEGWRNVAFVDGHASSMQEKSFIALRDAPASPPSGRASRR